MNINIDDLQDYGFLKIPISPNTNLVDEIKRMKKEKNAVILGHFYIESQLQDISDYVGDSLGLSQQAAQTNADVIVFLGVHFMAETAKILSPGKKVLLPDLQAGCSLADSCPPDAFADFIKQNPNHLVISYVNTTAEIKALTDIVCTSSNAVQIVESLPKDQKLIFGPDQNLGNYINGLTGRNMAVWQGACHVHQQFSLEKILEIKKSNPDAKILAHPECKKPVQVLADYVGSTSGILKHATQNPSQKFIVATESGILHQLKLANPNKTFIPAPPEVQEGEKVCACNDCEFMKRNTMEKLYNCLKYEMPEIQLDETLRRRAYKPIRRMLDISEKLGL